MNTASKKIEILDFAQEVMQKRGYNGFSYADISKAVGIRKASVHHHFASKELLGVAVVHRYKESFFNQLKVIYLKKSSWINKIREYAKLYEVVLKDDRLCLCGMLASDIETLPKSMKREIQTFFEENMQWLSSVLSLHYRSFSKKRLYDLSSQIVSSLQGAVLVAKLLDNSALFTAASNQLFSQIENIK